MKKPAIINARIHGIIDYLVVVFLVAAPTLFGLSEYVSLLTYGLAGIHLILTAITQFPLGIVKTLPFPLHGIVEVAASVVIILAPWIFGFAEEAAGKWFYILFGVAVFLTWLLSDYKPADAA